MTYDHRSETNPVNSHSLDDRMRAADTNAPMIIDTDIGDDPDDAFALAIAARHMPKLRLVITSDEYNGIRARFARRYLDLLGRNDVVVAQGPQVRSDVRRRIDHLVPPEALQPSREVLTEVRKVAASDKGRIRWLGIGAFTNLAQVMTEAPDIASRLDVALMGGAINYRHPDRASHNIRMDIDAARTVVDKAHAIQLVLSDHTYVPGTRVGPDSPIYQALRDERQEGTWQALLLDHVDAWYALAPHEPVGTLMNDPLTLSVSMGLQFVRSEPRDIRLDEIGRMIVDQGGRPALLSSAVHYPEFMDWVAKALGVEITTGIGPVVPLRL